MQRGTIVHYVLQKIIECYKKDVANLTENEISVIVDNYISEYLDGIPGYRNVETARMRYIKFTIARSLKEVVLHISKEFAQSDFEPVRCEFEIGSKEAPHTEIPVSDNKKILLEGSVDRVDVWNGYIRIVDYKTGKRKFKLPDILVGQNMQMLIYLYSLIKNSIFSDNKPAGIFYMPSKRDIQQNKLRMDGLSVLDEDVVNAMEKNNGGNFVTPLKYTKEGEIYEKYKNGFIPEEDFKIIFDHIEKILFKMGKEISNGEFSIDPIDGIDSPACKYCDFSSVCRIEGKACKKVTQMENTDVIELLKVVSENGVSTN
ncbi:MAG: PD-(D/E)XK nuclease family protein, partial [Clostridia bacterium]|nr:PD-(D/E)XK nuclease family protein [Clostridia bacterium]